MKISLILSTVLKMNESQLYFMNFDPKVSNVCMFCIAWFEVCIVSLTSPFSSLLSSPSCFLFLFFSLFLQNKTADLLLQTATAGYPSYISRYATPPAAYAIPYGREYADPYHPTITPAAAYGVRYPSLSRVN